MTTPPFPERIEVHRTMWRRDEELRVESAADAERFIEDVWSANTLTDARRAGPSFRHRALEITLVCSREIRLLVVTCMYKCRRRY